MKFNSLTRRILSVLLLLSLILSIFSVFIFAASDEPSGDEAQTGGLNVVYNRNFSEGWNYTNGLGSYSVGRNAYSIEYVKNSPSNYNYYLKVDVLGKEESYLSIESGDNVITSGKQFFSFDVLAEEGTNVPGAVVGMTAGEGGESEYVYFLSFINGEMYALGNKVGTADGEWHHFAFAIDYDYAKNTEGASEDEFRVTLYKDGEVYDNLLSTGRGGFGLSRVLIGSAAVASRGADESYLVDTVALYGGADTFTAIPQGNCGSAVDRELDKDMTIISSEKVENPNLISGTPTLERTDDLTSLNLIYNRHFGEGWNWNNGVNSDSSNTIGKHLVELRYDHSFINNNSGNILNHYLAIEKKNATEGYVFLATSSANPTLVQSLDSKLYIELDLKASYNNGSLYMALESTEGEEVLVYADEGTLVLLGQRVGDIGEKWLHIAFEIDFTTASSRGEYTVKAYYGESGESVQATYSVPNSTVKSFKLGTRLGSGAVGDWFGVDNLQVYTGTERFANLPKNTNNKSCGSLVDMNRLKDFALSVEAMAESAENIYEQSLTMKLGSDFMYVGGAQLSIFETEDGVRYGAPLRVGDAVMIPLMAVVEYTGAQFVARGENRSFEIYLGDTLSYLTLGDEYATIGGKRVKLAAAPAAYKVDEETSYIIICKDDVEAIFPGYYVTWDDMGLLTVSTYENFIHRDMDGAVDLMVKIMRKFLFDFVDSETVYEMAKENTNDFDHPYIFANQDRFDELRAAYTLKAGDEGFDPVLQKYIQTRVDKANEIFDKIAKVDDTGRYVGIKDDKHPINTNYDTLPGNNGYDIGGRLNLIYSYTNNIEDLAFAYQMTRDDRFARLTLDYVWELCDEEKWPHWGPAHFLNVSESVVHMAIGYDWCYDAWMEIDSDKVYDIRAQMYSNGVYHGWASGKGYGIPAEDYSPTAQYRCYNYHVTTNNWNPVCSVGMVVASFAILDVDTAPERDDINNTTALQHAKELISMDIYTCVKYSMHLYAPDGVYTESVGYWDASTSTFHQLVAALVTVTGDDFGYLDTWGMDKTYYFAFGMESSDHRTWPFHDDSPSELETAFMTFYARAIGDDALANVRMTQIAGGKTPTIYDAIFYEPMNTDGELDLPLDYSGYGLEVFTARSSWDPGALYTGIMGGYNAAGHAHLDSGNWVYYNEGVAWFIDMGSDTYTALNYFSNYHLYRRSGEGHNLLLITGREAFEYGQLLEATGYLTESYSDSYGGYAIIDQTEVYGDVCISAKRGLLLTNDRKTMVIQDEVQFNTMISTVWIGHMQVSNGAFNGVRNVEIDTYNPKVAYLTARSKTSGEDVTLRLTITSGNIGARFELLDAGINDYIMPKTTRPSDYAGMSGVSPEVSRTGYKRLVVRLGLTKVLKLSVTMELVDLDAELEVGYKHTEMTKWKPTADGRKLDASKVKIDTRISRLNEITTVLSKIRAIGEENIFSSEFERFYGHLGDIAYILEKNKNSSLLGSGRYPEWIAEYEGYLDRYNRFISNARIVSGKHNELLHHMFGINQNNA